MKLKEVESKKIAATSVVFPSADDEFQFAQLHAPPSTDTICAPLALTIDAVWFGSPALPAVQLSLYGNASMEPSRIRRVYDGRISGTSAW